MELTSKDAAAESSNTTSPQQPQQSPIGISSSAVDRDLESVQSAISTLSNESNSVVFKKNPNLTPQKSGVKYFPKMDTVAHSRKNASRLAVPTGADPFSSPRGAKGSGGSTAPTLTLSAWQYWSRLTDLRQMDMQSALDQMKTLMTFRPQTVYKTSYYRKQTKNHWARDDPAFLFLQAIFLIISSVAYAVAFRISFTGAISFLLYTVVWNWLGMGIALATLCREIANRQLVGQQAGTSSSHVRQQVEWLYAFDIHCNSFFPVFVVLCKWTLVAMTRTTLRSCFLLNNCSYSSFFVNPYTIRWSSILFATPGTR